jgi:hypothetical protein
MTDSDDGVWRDEQRLPLSELTRAIAAPANDGEVDDATGSEAGAESVYGHDALPRDDEPDRQAGEDPRERPSTTGRTGPA